jgi:hypothetical protein
LGATVTFLMAFLPALSMPLAPAAWAKDIIF